MEQTYLQNREISWLRFNERVLEEAEAVEVPLLEKLKFISIFTSNLDEFFMIRVGSLHDLSRLKKTLKDPKTGWTTQEQIDAIVNILPPIYAKRDRIYQRVSQSLAERGIERCQMKKLDKEGKKAVRNFYERDILPLLSPQIIDPQHPFPFLENKKNYLFCEIERDGQELFGLVPLRKSFPRYLILPGVKFRYILLEDIVEAYLGEIFKDYNVLKKYRISITRNFDMTDNLDTKDEFEDYKEYMKLILKKRKRLSPVRLELNRRPSPAAEKFLLAKLELEKSHLFVCEAPLEMSYVYDLMEEIPSALRQELSYPEFRPFDPLAKYPSISEKVRREDVLLSYPYEDMNSFIRLLEEAVNDPDCLSIKITIYRLAKNSKIVKQLVRAAERGIEVTVFMELKARFDEESNIYYSNILYEAGCQIIYGFQEYKIHSKLLLITYRNKKGQLSYITQIGTGNYNENTAKLYTDFALITGREDFGLDARDFFRNMAIGKLDGKYKNLIQAPSSFKQKILSLLAREKNKGEDGYVFCKFNSLTDKDICQAISEVSQAGGQVRLIIRGITCLLPAVPGATERVEIHSIVGRFLEHSRVYSFGRENPEVYIASADLMTRNTERRVEIAVPIYDQEIKERLLNYLEIQWNDSLKGRRMSASGEYIQEDGDFSAQDVFLEKAEEERNQSLAPANTKALKEEKRRDKKSLLRRLVELMRELFALDPRD
ncbi:MAG: polyphosphate kinase 1 [Eubacteriales bacterium]|nr:polyphosphate kinase 1 [Eubacteriales bacterium]